MTVEDAICTRVLDLMPVTALVSTRVYLLKLPQKPTYPAVRIFLVVDEGRQHLRGPDGFSVARVQIDCFAAESSGGDPDAAAAALEAAVHGDGLGTSATGVAGWKGDVGSPAFHVRNCRPLQRFVRYDPDELRLVTMSRDYLVSYHEMT